ncbi:tautomerase family protein [Aureivirga marina]|uniref:tautomerase family protein n=1 Tax=Aureivirga marina TaxID=1182451 RepID=UPI0018C9BFB5|nr:4-oxalocrotonate tautomerase family protein [Aureivirga marina]
MPYINIKVTDENVTNKQKQLLIEGVTKILVDVLDKKPETTHIVIDEVPITNWGFNGEQYAQSKKFKNEK